MSASPSSASPSKAKKAKKAKKARPSEAEASVHDTVPEQQLRSDDHSPDAAHLDQMQFAQFIEKFCEPMPVDAYSWEGE